ncbi:hypothetical protein PR202_ga12892 [Eleusine coracana subsp. coracana]|uniref:Reverse transcriptase zinc-binding domain-containing protein n=1 Tax=Eleusine coracana subsp. coracana TaxID=191504 RepID=A0AAV5CDD0_ELECO|nr:hypothetical protein PR202_ga12892 [Eleusine coracana subsp. coracana]
MGPPSYPQVPSWYKNASRVQNLRMKNIVNNHQCEVCANGTEDTGHIFFGCSFTQSFLECHWELGFGTPPRGTAIALLCYAIGSSRNTEMKWFSDQHNRPCHNCWCAAVRKLNCGDAGYLVKTKMSATPGLDNEPEVQQMFDTSIEIKIEDGLLGFFWTDRWLNGPTIQSLAPDLV